MTFVNIIKSPGDIKLHLTIKVQNEILITVFMSERNRYFLRRTKQQCLKASVDSHRRRKLNRPPFEHELLQHQISESLSEHRTNALISIPSVVSTIICSFRTVTKHEIGSWHLCKGNIFVETFIEPNQCHHDCVEKKSNLF